MASDLVKQALSPQVLETLSRSAKGFGAGAGMGSLVGAGTGAAVGGVQGYRHARQEGAGVGRSLLHGTLGAGLGAAGGAALGTAAGGVAGAVRPTQALVLGQRGGALGAMSRFGQRQVHGLTGVGDAAYIRSIGGGAAHAEKGLDAARAAVSAASTPEARAAAEKGLGRAQDAYQASEKAERMGLTSLPGYTKALWNNPREALSAGLAHQWKGTSAGEKALTYGIPASFVASELAHKEDPSGEGRGQLERVGRAVGAGTMGLLGPLPIAADMALSGGIGAGLGRFGRALDKLKQHGVQQPPTQTEPPGAMTQPSDYVMSDRAAGIAPDGAA